MPEESNVESFRQLRTDWDAARCNFARHLVRTGEHYGVTSDIYKLTEEKWDSIDKEWKQNLELMAEQLDSSGWETLGLTKSAIYPCEQVKLPRIHDNEKFPELGDEGIVGPMSVAAPASNLGGQCGTKSPKKRAFFEFFRGLFSKA